MEFKQAAFVAGQPFPPSPANPVPDGWLVMDGRLFPLYAPAGGAGASWESSAGADIDIDELIREEIARNGWSAKQSARSVPCRACAACRAGKSRRCLRPLTGAAAAAQKGRQQRLDEENELEQLLRSYGNASGVTFVESVAAEVERTHRRAELGL